MTGTSHNAGGFIISTRNTANDPERPIFSNPGPTNRRRVEVRNMKYKIHSQSKEVTRHLSSVWMGKSRDWGTLLLPEERFARFGWGSGQKEARKRAAEEKPMGTKLRK